MTRLCTPLPVHAPDSLCDSCYFPVILQRVTIPSSEKGRGFIHQGSPGGPFIGGTRKDAAGQECLERGEERRDPQPLGRPPPPPTPNLHRRRERKKVVRLRQTLGQMGLCGWQQEGLLGTLGPVSWGPDEQASILDSKAIKALQAQGSASTYSAKARGGGSAHQGTQPWEASGEGQNKLQVEPWDGLQSSCCSGLSLGPQGQPQCVSAPQPSARGPHCQPTPSLIVSTAHLRKRPTQAGTWGHPTMSCPFQLLFVRYFI